jgi:hypothetical protein
MPGSPEDEANDKGAGGHPDQHTPSYAVKGRLKHVCTLVMGRRTAGGKAITRISSFSAGQALIQDKRRSQLGRLSGRAFAHRVTVPLAMVRKADSRH